MAGMQDQRPEGKGAKSKALVDKEQGEAIEG